MMVVLVDKLVKTQIVECSAVANWIFSSEVGSELTNFYLWEILTSTIEKMNRQVEKYQNEINDLRRQLNLSAAVSSMISNNNVSQPTTSEENEKTIESEKTEENPMDAESEITTEEKSSGNNLKRRRESDDEDKDENTTNKVQSMHISAPALDEATAKLHEKYEIVEERLTHAREQQK